MSEKKHCILGWFVGSTSWSALFINGSVVKDEDERQTVTAHWFYLVPLARLKECNGTFGVFDDDVIVT